jgi:transcriptional regulator with XRE-family HTH domain
MARVGEELKKSRLDAGFTVKQVAKKLGVTESFVNDVEMGRKVISEDIMNRFSKVLNKNIATMGLGSLEEAAHTETVERTKETIKKEVYVAPKTPVNELWNQAFGENIKNVPVFDYGMKNPLAHRSHVVENKKIDGHPMDKVVMLQVENDDLKGYRIQKGDLVTGVEVKDIQGTAVMLISLKGKNILRKVRNLNNGTVELLTFNESQQSLIVPLKEIRTLLKLYKAEIRL